MASRMAHQHFRILLLLMYSTEPWFTRTKSADGSWHIVFSAQKLADRLKYARYRVFDQVKRLTDMGAVEIIRQEGSTIHLKLASIVPNAPGAPWGEWGPGPETDRRQGPPRDPQGQSGGDRPGVPHPGVVSTTPPDGVG